MVHLIIKELAHSAEDIIMVTSTIMKDTGGGTDAIYRPNAIRALCRIIDVSEHRTIMGYSTAYSIRLPLFKVSSVS
jgi:coatomer protein complex subunit gamma